jgi:hypothetical protein
MFHVHENVFSLKQKKLTKYGLVKWLLFCINNMIFIKVCCRVLQQNIEVSMDMSYAV